MGKVKSLKKRHDILNSEGMILGLFEDYSGQLYLGSFLSDGSGTIYYQTSDALLTRYLNSELKLNELYNDSPDISVMHLSSAEENTYLKEEFTGKLQCGDQYYSEVSDGLKSRR